LGPPFLRDFVSSLTVVDVEEPDVDWEAAACCASLICYPLRGDSCRRPLSLTGTPTCMTSGLGSQNETPVPVDPEQLGAKGVRSLLGKDQVGVHPGAASMLHVLSADEMEYVDVAVARRGRDAES
jgi:hypothetical protein